MKKSEQLYEENGVIISSTSIKPEDEITLYYSGLLLKSGADSVYAYVDYGKEWENQGFIPVEWHNGSFMADLRVSGKDSLNVAFKDSAENWDNNSTNNYVFKITRPTVRRTIAKTLVQPAEDIISNIKREKKAVLKASDQTTTKATSGDTPKRAAKSPEKSPTRATAVKKKDI